MAKAVESKYTKESLKEELVKVLDLNFMVSPENASDRQFYLSLIHI